MEKTKKPLGEQEQLQLRAPNRNAKILWVNQLQKAIDACDIAIQLKKAEVRKKPMLFNLPDRKDLVLA